MDTKLTLKETDYIINRIEDTKDSVKVITIKKAVLTKLFDDHSRLLWELEYIKRGIKVAVNK